MSKYLIPFMFASWMVGLLWGFTYGLNELWNGLILYISLVILVEIILIFVLSKQSEVKK